MTLNFQTLLLALTVTSMAPRTRSRSTVRSKRSPSRTRSSESSSEAPFTSSKDKKQPKSSSSSSDSLGQSFNGIDVSLYALVFVSMCLTQGGTPLSSAPYMLCFAGTLLFRRNPSSRRNVFLVMSLLLSVAVGVVMGPSLPLKGPAIPLLCGYIGMQVTLPFLLASMAPEGIPEALRLPLHAVVTEYVHSRIFPYGSYGILPYCQFSDKDIMQLAALGGVWLIEVYVGYVSSALALAVADKKYNAATAKRLLTVAAVVGAVKLHGGLRLRFLSWEGAGSAGLATNVRIAGAWTPNTMVVREHLLRHHLGVIMDGKPGPGEDVSSWGTGTWEKVVDLAIEDWEAAVKEVEKEAKAGAKVVMFPELSLVAFDDVPDDRASKAKLLETLARAARDNGVFVGAGIGYNRPFEKVQGLSKFTEIVLEKTNGMMGVESNRFLLFSPTDVSEETVPHSQVAIDYRKRNPVPIIEGPFGLEGDAVIPIVDVEFHKGLKTKTGSVICFDMEHPWHVRQLYKSSVILNPSYDWPGLNPYHARIAAFRAVETGTSVFHHCLAGTTLAVDYLGNILQQGDYFAGSGDGTTCIPLDPDTRCNPPNHVANLPLVGVWTLYGAVGDFVVWISAATLIYSRIKK